jgi:hypothetical protein
MPTHSSRYKNGKCRLNVRKLGTIHKFTADSVL